MTYHPLEKRLPWYYLAMYSSESIIIATDKPISSILSRSHSLRQRLFIWSASENKLRSKLNLKAKATVSKTPFHRRQHSTSSQASKLSMHSLDQNYNFYFDHGGIHGSAGGGRQGHGRGAVSLSGMPMPMMEMVTVTVTEMVMELQVVVVRGMEERFHFLGCQCQARQIHIRMHPVVTNWECRHRW